MPSAEFAYVASISRLFVPSFRQVTAILAICFDDLSRWSKYYMREQAAIECRLFDTMIFAYAFPSRLFPSLFFSSPLRLALCKTLRAGALLHMVLPGAAIFMRIIYSQKNFPRLLIPDFRR